MIRSFVWSLVCALVLPLGWSEASRADAASATVTPATGGSGAPLLFGHTEFDLATVGYEQSEFFISGMADAYESAAALSNDGKWTVTPFSPAAYETRVVVNRPIDPADFNGTVVVEWLNVTGNVDASPDWAHMHVELIREGYAWVGVSAQWNGVNHLKCLVPTAPFPPCPAPLPGDPARYGSLIHPGDSWSYDIFSQAGQAIRDQAALVLGGLVPERLIAAGESQSAGRLTTYIDGVHPLVEVYDGFVVHSRGDDGSPLTQSTAGPPGFSPPTPETPFVPAPDPTYIRDDLFVPVMVLATESDRGSLEARQPDSALYRLWEVAGTAHFDFYGLTLMANDTGSRATVGEWFDSMLDPPDDPNPFFTCPKPINTGPATFVLRALIRALNTWLVDGTPALVAPRFQLIAQPDLSSDDPADIYELDGVGDVLGGIRTPAVDAPVARLNGVGQPSGGLGGFCSAFGVTEPLEEEQLTDLYGDHDGFVAAWMQATQDAVKEGFVLREDAQDLRVVGAQSDILE